MNRSRIRRIGRTVRSDLPDLLRAGVCFALAYGIFTVL